ncbi:aldo/keto reductase [Longibacter salinarum]|uniref:Aldo/keto reductase n=1 Tax=Longibacter salinarum TaxID=1850348 RepID=A0A2A8CVK5_9BACT|nr:aldo/keto reductase [Longibacter salinarum]PEN12643.1 aldo/keto reductase [Longibacter salinarum]
MQTRSFGSTGLTVTSIGLGLAALGRPGYINLGHGDDLEGRREVEALEQHTHDMLDAAWDLGIRYFDAARSYGKAESFLGSWLRLRGRAGEDATVGSKWGYTYTADWQVDADVHEVKDHSLSVLQRQWPESRERLGEHLDLYQIHSATLSTGVLEDDQVMGELARLKHNEGIAIGLSLSGPNQADTLERALEVKVDGEQLFDAVQATWNLLEPSAETMLQAASDAGLGVIVKEVLANGRLTPRNDREIFSDRFSLLKREASRLDTTVDALAMAAVIAQPWVDVALSGAATTSQLRSNVAALDVHWDDTASNALAVLAEEPSQYWDTRGNLPWN